MSVTDSAFSENHSKRKRKKNGKRKSIISKAFPQKYTLEKQIRKIPAKIKYHSSLIIREWFFVCSENGTHPPHDPLSACFENVLSSVSSIHIDVATYLKIY